MPPDQVDASSEDTELATTIGLYALGELSLGEAASRADVSRIGMREILDDAGIALRFGPQTKEEASDDVDVARRANE
ncbi:hypothetical protein BRC81_04765 [Halobacteriales archaeon QS_1_68_20]|nr:MAG: hypothetical protein BRC81_04765 [Halobacteriales archaeon QS_1_68_20]